MASFERFSHATVADTAHSAPCIFASFSRNCSLSGLFSLSVPSKPCRGDAMKSSSGVPGVTPANPHNAAMCCRGTGSLFSTRYRSSSYKMTSASAATFADVEKPPFPLQQCEPVGIRSYSGLICFIQLSISFYKYGKSYFYTPQVRKAMSI